MSTMTPAFALPAAARDDAALLALWEHALALDAPAREAWLASGGGALAPAATLGEQRSRLLPALASWCGRQLALRSRCPRCGELLSFTVDPEALAEAGHAAIEARELQVNGWSVRFRALGPAYLDAALRAGGAADEAAFVEALLARCVLAARHGAVKQPADALPADVVQRLAEALEAADPLASIAFDLRCPACAHAWLAPFDAAQALWSCVQAAAERLLAEIDALAQRYGWSERQIVGLSRTRRRAYLQLSGLA